MDTASDLHLFALTPAHLQQQAPSAANKVCHDRATNQSFQRSQIIGMSRQAVIPVKMFSGSPIRVKSVNL